MLNESTIRKVLEALSDAGLCVCEASIIGPDHPGSISDFEYAIGRIEESGGLNLSDEAKCPNCERIQHVIGPCDECGSATIVL